MNKIIILKMPYYKRRYKRNYKTYGSKPYKKRSYKKRAPYKKRYAKASASNVNKKLYALLNKFKLRSKYAPAKYTVVAKKGKKTSMSAAKKKVIDAAHKSAGSYVKAMKAEDGSKMAELKALASRSATPERSSFIAMRNALVEEGSMYPSAGYHEREERFEGMASPRTPQNRSEAFNTNVYASRVREESDAMRRLENLLRSEVVPRELYMDV